MLDSAIEDPDSLEVCSTFPNPYDNDHRGKDEINPDDIPTRFDPDKPVFAKLPDGSMALYDSRLILHENTIDNPKLDGGGESVLRSTIRSKRNGLETHRYPWNEEYYVFNDHNIALCINEVPNFLNRDHCVLSYEPNACVADYKVSNVDVQLVLTFVEETLGQLHNITLASYTEANETAGTEVFDNSRYIYAVDGLRYDDSNTDVNTSSILPCTGENPTSRWKPRDDLNETECVSNLLQSDTVEVFKRALETSNDENPYLRDIYLWNEAVDEDGCNDLDLYSYGMLIWTDVEGCWENVHPDFM